MRFAAEVELREFLERHQIRRTGLEVQVRVPDPDEAWSGEAWCIADDGAILHRVQDGQYTATLETAGSALARAKLREFERLWERATTDPSLRRLHV